MITQIYKYFLKIKFFRRDFIVKENFHINGFPYIIISKSGSLQIGKNVRINNSLRYNPIGRNHRSILFVGERAKLLIGNNVKMSGSAVVAMDSVIIEDNVMIGGNTVIYDSDFHSIDFNKRNNFENKDDVIKKSVHICKNVFIGAHSTILKGVKIGENSVIGAGSVVFSKVPANQVWAGNPAKFIYSLSHNKINNKFNDG